ncbi:MAG: histidine ammonia-lyase [Alphaproteobacteria bacterium CG_4_9_14_3_um_filter_47_13]|nr:MAG: histidine ammonia-lyase [Alphaproteobacteria bacterium CG_4_9_14_3_um_filter_47_13]
MMHEFEIKPGNLTLADLRQVYRHPARLSLPQEAWDNINAGCAVVEKALESGTVIYGINTGFGKLAREKVSAEKLEKLQDNLILSHCTGTGYILYEQITRLILVLKINALAQGYSGVRPDLVKALIALVNHEVYPCIPSKGSVGASGDLAPLAHMSAVLLGYGEVTVKGKTLPAKEGLALAGLQPMKLAPKEGLALINGTQVSAALALAALFATENCFANAVIAGALSLEAAKASTGPFDPKIQIIRRQQGQIDVAAKYLSLLDQSEIRDSHKYCGKVQDPYCLRCMPQVMGACLDLIRNTAQTLECEANAVTDNPLVFAQSGEILSGGNFHAEPVAFAADTLALAIAEIGNISERRIAMLIDENQSHLPPFLVKDAGVNSGFMIAHVTAAALASENKQKSHPASVDSIPTSAGQEDHVSMATHGARRLIGMAENTAVIVAIELLAATQGIEFHRPLRTSSALETVTAIIRKDVPYYKEDRYFAPDIQAAKNLVESDVLLEFCSDILPSCAEVFDGSL